MPIFKSCPHRVKTLEGTDLVVKKVSNRICTCYAIKSMAVRNVGSPYWHQRSNDVSFWRICITNQYVFLAGFTGQIYPRTGVKAVLSLLGILSSLSDIKNVTYLNFQLANTSNWNTCSMISERLDVAQSEIKDCSRAYVHVFNGLFIFDVLS